MNRINAGLRKAIPSSGSQRTVMAHKMDKYNTSVDNTTLYLYTKIIYIYIFCQGDMFRPYKVILRLSKKTDSRVVYVSLHCGMPNAYKLHL